MTDRSIRIGDQVVPNAQHIIRPNMIVLSIHATDGVLLLNTSLEILDWTWLIYPMDHLVLRSPERSLCLLLFGSAKHLKAVFQDHRP